MNDDDLLGELEGLDDEDTEAAKLYIEQIRGLADEEKKQALKEKKANNIDKAKKHLAQMKKFEKDLEEQYDRFPNLRPKAAEVKAVVQPQEVQRPEPVKQKVVEPKKSEPVAANIPSNTDDDIEMEEEIHDIDKMVAMSVIEAEMEVIAKLMKASKDSSEKDFYSDKHSSLEFQKNTIESNIQIGIMTPEKYMSNIKAYL